MRKSDHKKAIMEHLAKSSASFNIKQPLKPIEPPTPDPAPTPAPTPVPTPLQARKTSVMEHLARSSETPLDSSRDEAQRKKQIKDHLRLSLG